MPNGYVVSMVSQLLHMAGTLKILLGLHCFITPFWFGWGLSRPALSNMGISRHVAV